MSKTAHTPGPWQHSWQFIVAPDPAGIHADIYIAEIAETDETGRIASPRQRQANARLIAAAPEQHEALAIAEEMLSAIADGETFPARDYMERLHTIRKAIAKAKGGSI